MADITATRRKKLLAYLAQEGGTMAIGPLHDWSGLKLLAAHQAFSQLMEGLTADGLVNWDGQIFTLTAEGRAAVEAGTGGKAATPEEPESDHGHSHDHGHDHGHSHERAAAPPPPPPEPAHDHGHSHEHDHGHSHEHARSEPQLRPPPPPPRAAPPPPPPEKKGVRASLKRVVKGILGR